MFSDLIDCLHYFSNDQDMRIDVSPAAMTTKTKPRRPLDQCPIYAYSLDDYPFIQVLEGQKRDHSEAGSYRKTLAEMRQEMMSLNPGFSNPPQAAGTIPAGQEGAKSI